MLGFREKMERLLLYVVVVWLTIFLIKSTFFREEAKPNKQIISYLDSVQKTTAALMYKVDSLNKVKVELYSEVTKVKLKYDTIKITIDSMLPVDATIFLLSKSRQLTAKGVE